MIRAGLALVLLTPLPALADTPTFCGAVTGLQAAAANPEGSETMVFPGTDIAADCAPALELGGVRSMSCNWTFPYRATEAQVAFEALSAALTECFDEAVATDTPVNHPDTYDLRIFEGGASAALKDKANLGETLVILRVQG